MKILRLFLVTLLLASASGLSAKLTKFVLRGYLREQDYVVEWWKKKSVDTAYVSIVQNDTVLVPFKMLRGNDEMKMVTDGELRAMVQGGVGDYTLIINAEGYAPFRHDFKVASEGQDVVYLRTLDLERERHTELKELDVVGTAIKMVMKGDTVVYDSRAFQLAEGSTLNALVAQLPGVELSDDGSMTMNGRKIQSLLIDGNDFFKGDPQVALKNLPSYTVDKIKVYDKAADNDYLTNKSQQLSESVSDQNLVMDVRLKKEFSMATIINLEGGYGPGIYKDGPKKWDSRYIGRFFGIGIGRNYRFSVYGNTNNINNVTRASSEEKGWDWGGSKSSGDSRSTLGGFDLYWQPNKKNEFMADGSYTREDSHFESLTAKTSFYPTRTLYGRYRSHADELAQTARGRVGVRHRGDNLFIAGSIEATWMSTHRQTQSFTVNLDANPFESYRGAVIDSVFNISRRGLVPSAELTRIISSTNYTSTRNYGQKGFNPQNLNIVGEISMNYRPKSIRTGFVFNGSVTDRTTKDYQGNLYFQTLADAALTPNRRTQWSGSEARRTMALTTPGVQWSKRFMNDVRSHTLQIDASTGWEMMRDYSNRKYQYELLADGFDISSLPLPSQTATIGALVDADNTVRSLSLRNTWINGAGVDYSIEPMVPGDSTVNLKYNIRLNYTFNENFRHLSYGKYYADFDYHKDSTDPTHKAGMSFTLSSNNKLRNWYLLLNYGYSTSLLNMLNMVPTINNSNPLDVYLGPADGVRLKTPSTHRGYISGFYYNNRTKYMTYSSLSVNKYQNSEGYAAVFDPASGITTHRPISVNGNWNIYASTTHSKPFGPLDCWNAHFSVNYYHGNDVDYLSAVGAPQRSVVKNDELSGRVSLSYSIKGDGKFKGTNFRADYGAGWQHSRSATDNFRAINALVHTPRASIGFFLPWDIEGNTSLGGQIRRGYEDSALNTTEWVWNATVQKSILNGKLIFKVNAVDLLGQRSTVTYQVNSQGRTEVWQNNLPRYVMLTVTWRINYTPNAMK